MNIELKHLAPYLPFELMGINSVNKKVELTSVDLEFRLKTGFKPILRPLSDLIIQYSDIANYDDARLKKLKEEILNGFTPYNGMQLFLRNHFDVFGLIPKGLAIDINTLD